MDVSAYKRKFELLFDTILKDNIEISAYHSENILKQLDGRRDNCTEKILDAPFFTELIIYVLKNSNSATNSVKVFIANIVRIVLRNEVHFNRFLHMGGFELMPWSSEEYRALPAALHRAHVQQVGALADHYSGLKYIMDQKFYRQLLQPHTHHHPPALARSIYDFMSKLIWKLNEYDEEAALQETLQFIVQPIATVDLEFTTSRGVECEMDISDQLLTYLHTLVAILGEIDNLIVPNKVVPILMRFGVVESTLATILVETRDPALASLLAELGVRYHLAASLLAARCAPAAADRANEDLIVSYSKIITTLVKKRSIFTIMDFIIKCQNYWYKVQEIWHSTSFERFGRRFEIRDTFLIMLLVPLFTKCKAKQKPVDDHELQEAFEIFTYGLARDFPHDIVKPAYSLRALVEETGTNAACVRAVRELLGPRRLCRRQAGIVFQILYYTLSEYVLSDGAGALVLLHNPLRAPDDEQLVGAVLDAIKALLEEHDLSWYESVEIVNLQAALINLIKQNILPMKPLVQVVELMTLSVRKLLPPELALLLQSARGGSLREAAAAARALLAHPEPRVRAAAFAFIHSFAEVAYVKFPALQRVISEHALLAGAARAALGEPAARAQAAALRCLAAGARCHCLWAELLADHHDLYEHLLQIVQHGADGEVRAAAAGVLTAVYVSRRVSGAFEGRVSRVMARAAADACPRAQLAALDFWRQAAKTIFSDRGMIDCQFPPVTFSKEKRKIIVLTDDEIRKQLDVIIDRLSTCGFLGVLLQCLAPHNDVKVIEKAYEFANELVRLLEFYKFDVKPAQRDLFSEIFSSYESDSSRDDGSAPPEVVHPHVFLEMFKSTDYEALINSLKLAAEPAHLDTLMDEVTNLARDNQCNDLTAL